MSLEEGEDLSQLPVVEEDAAGAAVSLAIAGIVERSSSGARVRWDSSGHSD